MSAETIQGGTIRVGCEQSVELHGPRPRADHEISSGRAQRPPELVVVREFAEAVRESIGVTGRVEERVRPVGKCAGDVSDTWSRDRDPAREVLAELQR